MTHISDDLIRFPKLDPIPTAEKTVERSKLQRDIDAYLASGGVITEHDTTECVHYPIRRTREAQINFVRHKSWNKLNNRK